MMSFIIAIAAAFGLIVVSIFIAHVGYASYKLRNKDFFLFKGDASQFDWHVFVPALNEESVIGGTIERLCSFGVPLHVWVINDNSDDSTRNVILNKMSKNSFVHLVDRSADIARTGKGDALNYAFYKLLAWRKEQRFVKPDSQTIVGVVDADGRLMPQTFDVLAGDSAFGRPEVGAVQQDVWMHNADDQQPFPGASSWKNKLGSIIVKLQDIEFRAAIAGIQNARHKTVSVSMGGNGQWTRLATLQELSALDAAQRGVDRGVPWHGSLLEDFELGLHIMLAGWKTVFLPGLWVSQEALPDLTRYIRQRTRWTQGTMQCARYFPRLWRGVYIGPWALLEILYYLLQPWFWIIGTFLFPLPLYDVGKSFFTSPSNWIDWALYDYGWMWVAMFWIVALGPLMSWGLTYRKIHADPNAVTWVKSEEGVEHLVYKQDKEKSMSWASALGYGFAYVWLVQVSYVIVWKAFFRLIRGKNGWSKTSRNSQEQQAHVPISVETNSPMV